MLRIRRTQFDWPGISYYQSSAEPLSFEWKLLRFDSSNFVTNFLRQSYSSEADSHPAPLMQHENSLQCLLVTEILGFRTLFTGARHWCLVNSYGDKLP
jgi:hypothetical protein